MTALDDQLQRWRDAGLIDADAATRIREFEGARGAEPLPPPVPEAPLAPAAAAARGAGSDRPGVLEALIYLGISIVVLGLIVLVGSVWDDLDVAGRIAVLAVPAVLAIVLGRVLCSFREPGMIRGGHVTWLAALVLIAGTVAVIADAADFSEDDSALVASIVTLVAAVAFWLASQSHPQVVGVVASALFLTLTLGIRLDDNEGTAIGLLAVAFGAAGIALAEARLFPPHATSSALSALLAAFGSVVLLFVGEWGELANVAIAAALIATSILRGMMVYMLLGVALAFFAVLQLIGEHVSDPTLASLALIVVGVALIGVVLALMKFRPWRMARPAA